MLRRTAYLITLLLVVLALAPVAAQDKEPAPSPFLEMLARVPASAGDPDDNGNIFVSYADYRALEAARPGVPSPESLADFEALDEAEDVAAHLWRQNSMRLTSGWPEYGNYLFAAADLMPEVVGFDFFAIDRALNFNAPPADGTIFGGAFDTATIDAAYRANGYTQETINGILTWCSDDFGCDGGHNVSLTDRYLGRVFGDAFGRQQPVVVAADFIFSTPALPTLEAFTATLNGTADSLLDLPAFRAIGEAAVSTGTVIQAEFLRPAMAGFPVAVLQEDFDRLLAATMDYGSLPAYEMAALLDVQAARQAGADQMALIALVYPDQVSATIAAAELRDRLARLPFDIRALDDLLLDDAILNARLSEPATFYSEAADRWVALAGMAYPLPDNNGISMSSGEPLDVAEGGVVRASGMVWRRWISQLWQRAFTPLLIELPTPS